jgi:hypothetical protein
LFSLSSSHSFLHTHFSSLLFCFAVFTDDLLSRPAVEVEKALTFLGSKLARDALLIATSKSEWATVIAELHSPNAETGDEMALSSIPDALRKIAAEAIQSEMKSSKELTKWPCGLIRTLHDGEEKGKLRLPIDKAVLAANCTGRFVKCSVRFDQAGG